MKAMKSLVFYLAMAFAATALVTMPACEDKKEEENKEEGKEKEGEAAEGEGAAEEGGEAAAEEGGDEAAAEEGGEAAAEEGGEAAAEEGGEAAAEEGGEAAAADGGAWGENCQAYFAEVEKLCADVGDDPMKKPSCDAWLQAIEQQKKALDGVDAAAATAAASAAEEGCKAGVDGVKQAAAAW